MHTLNMDYSVVVPVYNERDSVVLLAKEIKSTMSRLDGTYEVIFVDDGSKDGTTNVLSSIKKIKIIRLRKNSGQSTALACGIDNAKGNIIITMDGDGQNDPKDIPKLLSRLNDGYDAVSGWRYNRKDPFGKRLFSRMANWLRHVVINDHLHDAGCSLKVYKKECFDDFELYGELHRYIAEIIGLKGFRVGEVKVNHRSRKAGKTKYGMKRVVKGMLDLFIVWFWQKYAGRPLHLFGGLGVVLGLFGMVLGLYAAYLKIFRLIDLSDTFLPVVAIFLVLAGLQLFVAGIMSDLLIRNYNKGKKRYSIREVVDT